MTTKRYQLITLQELATLTGEILRSPSSEHEIAKEIGTWSGSQGA